MKLNVIGCYGLIPTIKGANGSYLLEVGGLKILLDIGAGSLIDLRKVCELDDIDVIILSHLHCDHINDLHVSRHYYYKYTNKVMPLYTPKGPQKELNMFVNEPCFDIKFIENNMQVNINGVKISFKEGQHTIPSFITKIEYEGKSFVYSGDTLLCDNLKEMVKNADFALLDSAFTEETKPEGTMHMSSYECAKLGKEMNIKKIMLTHLGPFQDRKDYISDALKGDNKDILLACPLVKVEF